VRSTTAYQVLGGIEDENDSAKSRTNRKFVHTEYLRHLDLTLDFQQQRYEDDGSVSMAGKAWEGSHVLADVITNPMVGSWLRGSSTGTTVSEVNQSSQPLGFGFTYQHAMGRGSTQDPHCYWTNKSVIELGSGIGIVYITASLLGANPVVATDASQTSLRLVEQNADHAKALVHVQELCWGGREPRRSRSIAHILVFSE